MNAPTVKIASGPVQGRADRAGMLSFLGLPYAAPPVGARRFAPPQPPAPWSDVRDATAPGPTAPQSYPVGPLADLLPTVIIPGEDYLNLNVWTGGLDGARPVMVFIHGGAFTSGSGVIPTYDGTRFARDGVVLVTINYRLGADGFLWFGEGTPNLGLLDQLAALEWVRENIHAFGGDPGNVTVFGESAGAMSVCTLLAMPAAAGLFRRAIAQSGAARCVISPRTATLIGTRLAEILGTDASRAAIAAVPEPQLLQAQSQLGEEVIADLRPERWGDVARNLMPFEPVVDGTLLPVPPSDAIRAGVASDVDVLIGTNTDEANLFYVPAGAAVSAREAMLAMTSDFYLKPALELAEDHHGSFVYEFAWRSPAFDGALGACHALELPFVFDTLDDPGYAPVLGRRPPQPVADAVHRAWVAFAATGDPGWPPYEPDSRLTMRFDNRSEVTARP